MSSFLTVTNPTPFGIFDSDPDFGNDANSMVVFIKRKLGDDILTVELTSKQIWACFEESCFEYSSLINQNQLKSQLVNIMGIATGSNMQGAEEKLPRQTLDFMMRRAEPYAVEAGLGGNYKSLTGSIDIVVGQQDYDLNVDLKDVNGSPLFDDSSNNPKSRMKILEVYHYDPQSAYRFFDTTSAINYLNNQFAFESFKSVSSTSINLSLFSIVNSKFPLADLS